MSISEVAIVNQNASVMDAYTREQINLIKSTMAKDATDAELKLFLYTANHTGLDPLTRQIHFVKRAGQMTIQTGIDGYRAIAERSGTLAGIDDPIFDSEDGPHPNKATVKVRRLLNNIVCEFSASARWSEYAPTGNQAFMWKKMPYLMLGKCAEALALRKAFPNNLSGIYTNEEMQQADAQTNLTPQPTVVSEIPKGAKEINWLGEVSLSDHIPEPDETSKKYTCSSCKSEITEKVSAYSNSKFGKALCMKCQKQQNQSPYGTVVNDSHPERFFTSNEERGFPPDDH